MDNNKPEIYCQLTIQDQLPTLKLNVEELESNFEISITDLFEAIDENDDGYYSEGIDTIVENSAISFSETNWKIDISLDANNNTIMELSMDNNYDFDLNVRFTHSGGVQIGIIYKLENYKFISQDESALLVFGMDLMLNSTNNNETTENSIPSPDHDREVSYSSNYQYYGITNNLRSVYYQIENIANTTEEIPVGLSIGNIIQDSNNTIKEKIFTSYNNFGGSLEHKALFGTYLTDCSICGPYLTDPIGDSDGISINGTSLGCISVSSLLGIIIHFISKKKQKKL